VAIDFEVKERIAYISFCRPDKHNALRDEDVSDLMDALRRFDRDDDALVAIVFGQGRSFSSGADVKSRLQDSVEAGSIRERTNEARAFYESENWKPVIAAVNGYCLGHALGTALLCDLVVAARDAVFQLTEITIGLPAVGAWDRLSTRPMFANEVALTGRHFTVDEAWDAGMITRIVDAGEHVAAAEELARQIMANPQDAVREQVRIRRNVEAARAAQAKTLGANLTRIWARSAEAGRRIDQKLQ
jgi:enoyl-CoA hydratase/carnithine racemase